ncbi:CDP-alcohol phosphatidyltransferase family protein [Candidatus Puniceispirillum sp.]|nr:CDP-alcohol phosphatidyltransferase family protein [Candidatus Puniceispirillum sp.]
MFDAQIRPLMDRLLDPVGRGLAARGVKANHVTIIGALFGLAAALCVAFQLFDIAFWLISLNRVADGLDGAVARASMATDFGGYLDIVCDFVFYSSIPVAFAAAQPENALASSFLIFSFIGTASSFLAFAILAEKHNISTEIRGKKAFYYLGGLTEGAETILLLLAMVTWPSYFIFMAFGFGLLCWVTTITRIYAAYSQFSE